MSYFDNNSYNFSNNNEKFNNYSNFDSSPDTDSVVSVGLWIVIFIVTAIPIVNFIALLIFAFGSGNKNIKNYARACLIVFVIVFFIALIIR